MKSRIASIIGIIILLSLLMAPPALAIDEPDSVSLEGITIFGDLLAEDDFLAFVPYAIPFTTEPDENISQTFIFRMLSADGTTELGTVLAIPAYNGGYGFGAVAFYSTNMTWGEEYIFRVQQNPTYYPLAQHWDFTIGDSNYSSASDQALALGATIITSAMFLSTSFDEELLSKSESGTTVLSTYGELYYLDVIPGLQSMCPDLFSVKLESPDYTKRTWSMSIAEALQTKYSGTFIYDSMTGFAGLFSMDTSPAMNFLSIIMFAILMGISVWKFKASMLSAFVDGYALLLLLMLGGFFSMIWAGFMAFCSTVLGGVILFLNRS